MSLVQDAAFLRRKAPPEYGFACESDVRDSLGSQRPRCVVLGRKEGRKEVKMLAAVLRRMILTYL